jgi:hypothetical protein
MMNRRGALLLVERPKRRTRDPDVLMLCEYLHGTDVHGTIPAFRRPGDGTPPAVFPSALCPVCAARRAAETARKKDGAMGAETDADVRVAWSPRGNLRLLPPRPALGRGRLQVQVMRAFAIHGPGVTTGQVFDGV